VVRRRLVQLPRRLTRTRTRTRTLARTLARTLTLTLTLTRYAVWNPYGAANYGDAGEETRCRCSDPEPGDDKLSSQLVEDPGYDTFSLAGPHSNLRPMHKIDGFDLDDDECIRHCAVESPGSTWVALWNPVGELDGALNAGMLSQNKRCLCEDTSKEYALDDAPGYDLYSLRGEC